MGSLTELTTFANTILTFTDNRPSGVIFDWPAARNINNTILDTSFIAERRINIVEIIDPATALVSYSIDVSAVSGATVTWDTIPSGCTVTVNSGVYTISGIDSVEDWNTVAAPSIDAPVTFNGSFFYTSSINYTTPEGRQSKSWTVGTFIPVALFQSSFTQTSIETKIHNSGTLTYPMTATFVKALPSVALAVPAIFSSTTSFTASSVITASGRFNKTARFTLSVTPTEIEALINHEITRTFDGNERNFPFATNPISTNYSNPGSFQFVITTSDGLLYHEDNEETNPYGTTVSLSSTNLSALIASLEEIEFYPDYNNTSNLTYNVSFYIDGSLAGGSGDDANLNYSGTTQPLETRVTTFSRTEFPVHPYAIQYYNTMDIYVLGGGGGGGIFNGGAGGGAKMFLNQTFNKSLLDAASFTTIGSGGTWNATSGNNTDGSATSFTYNGTSYTAPGGERGRDDLGRGGNTTSTAVTPVTYTGGAETSSGSEAAGGGGAGSLQNGLDATVSGSFVIWGDGGVGPIIDRLFEYEDGDIPIALSSNYGGEGGGGYSSNYTQEQKSGTEQDRSKHYMQIGNGGWAGPTNTDGKGDGADGGVIINFFRI